MTAYPFCAFCASLRPFLIRLPSLRLLAECDYRDVILAIRDETIRLDQGSDIPLGIPEFQPDIDSLAAINLANREEFSLVKAMVHLRNRKLAGESDWLGNIQPMRVIQADGDARPVGGKIHERQNVRPLIEDSFGSLECRFALRLDPKFLRKVRFGIPGIGRGELDDDGLTGAK
jgi:hypothetical protein